MSDSFNLPYFDDAEVVFLGMYNTPRCASGYKEDEAEKRGAGRNVSTCRVELNCLITFEEYLHGPVTANEQGIGIRDHCKPSADFICHHLKQIAGLQSAGFCDVPQLLSYLQSELFSRNPL